MNSFVHTLKGIFLITTGGGGLSIAMLKPWQEHLEWSARMLLVTASLASVLIGLWITLRKKPEQK